MGKNVGILTFQRTLNYGAMLQMYSLFRTFRSFGCDVEVIDYKCDAVENNELPKLVWGSPLSMARKLLTYKPMRSREKQFEEFRTSHIKMSQRCDAGSLPVLVKKYDAVFVGSDQVWNMQITDSDMSYFLPFDSGISKNSYAASFGQKMIPEECQHVVKHCLEQFNSISVREQAGIDILATMGLEARIDIDPTFLTGKVLWHKLAGESSVTEEKLPASYVLAFSIGDAARCLYTAKEMSHHFDLPCVMVFGNSADAIKMATVTKDVTTYVDASIELFCKLFRDASYVVTSSFHGMCLSIQNEKQFTCLTSGDAGKDARIFSLQHLLGLDSSLCVVSDATGKVEPSCINYDKCNHNVLNLTNTSKDYLYSIIR